MTLSEGFIFTQANLQDYIECQRRFQLRYLDRLDWPAVEVEPYMEYKRMLEHGLQFHKIVRQHLLGISESQIEHSVGDDEQMGLYWNNYKQSIRDGFLGELLKDDARHNEELSLSIPMNGYRLTAKYDVIIAQPQGRYIILDWKTSQRQPKRKWLAERMQTHIYPFVLCHGAVGITNPIPLEPQSIEMIYWFANHPDQPERFKYDTQTFEADKHSLEDITDAINRKTEPIFPLTPDHRRCLYCNFRSLCNRGVKPGDIEEMDQLLESDGTPEHIIFDFDQIAEIEF